MTRALLLFVALLGFAGLVASAERPHIIFILADDMGRGDIGCYGGKLAPTPNLDRLAAEGIRFEQYYSAAPICSPSRVGCFTGMFPARWKITSFLQERKGNRACEQVDFLDPAAPSMARALKGAGYATAHFGKWHMGGGRDVVDAPKFAAYGFDEHAGTWESPEAHSEITATNWIWSPEDKVKRWDRTAFFIDKTLDFLKRHKDRPVFVNLWLDDTHTPWVPDEDTQTKRPYRETPEVLRKVLVEMDRQIGRLLDGVRELGVDQQTLVLFATDNGALPTFQGQRTGGFRGSKLSLYEGGIRLPCIARWPGHVPAGRVDFESVFAAVDLLPTFCSIAGASLPQGAALDGEDLSAAITGKPTTRSRPLFWEYGRNNESFRYPQGLGRSPNLAMRDGPWKLLIHADGSGAELYQLPNDPKEETNLAAAEAPRAERMKRQLLAWRASLPKLEP